MRDMIDSTIARHGVTRAQFAPAERDRVWWSFDRALICLSTAAFTFRRTPLSASRRFAYGRRSALT